MQRTSVHTCAHAAHTSAEGLCVTTAHHADNFRIWIGTQPHEIAGRLFDVSQTPREVR